MCIWKIYRITGPNGKVYIGQTVQTIARRWKAHQSQKKGALQFAIRKYGVESFIVEHLLSCRTVEDANYFEQYLITDCNSLVHQNGYNIKRGGESGGLKAICKNGHLLSDENRNAVGKCKICDTTRSSAFYEANKDEIHIKRRAYATSYRARNREKLRADGKERVEHENARCAVRELTVATDMICQ